MTAVFAVEAGPAASGSLEGIIGMSQAGRVPRPNVFPHVPSPPHGTSTFQYIQLTLKRAWVGPYRHAAAPSSPHSQDGDNAHPCGELSP